MKRKCCLTVTGEISPTTRRWRRFRISWSFLSTSRQRHRLVVEITDSCFLNELRRRLQSRGESSRRLFLEQVIDALTSSSASASASGTGRAVLQELPHLTSPPRLLQDHQNIPARYRLRFINRVKNPSFTTDPVKDEEGNPIRVQLYDNCTKVSPDCFLPSDKVKISVIDSNGTVLSARKGKRPILTGCDLNVHLKNGVGTFKNIVFNDNSSWSELQLRVTVESEAGEGFFKGERVEEDVSAPFVVKDRKSKAFQKPDKLELTHEVEKLKKIGKGVRASRLKNKGINTVEKFLDLYFRDQSQLCKILDIKSDHNNWNVMVQHAMECVDEFHAKNLALETASQPQQFQTSVSNVPSVPTGLRVVGSSSSEPNPFEHNFINAGLPQLDSTNEPVRMEVPNAESTLSNMGQFYSISIERSRIGSMAEYGASENTSLPQQVSVDKQKNILNPNAVQVYFDNLNSNNSHSVSPLEEIMFGRITSQDQLSASSEDLVHPLGRNILSTNSGLHLVGSSSTVLNPCENNFISPGFEVVIPGDMYPMEDLLANAESAPENGSQFPSRSNSFDTGSVFQDFIEHGYQGPT